MFERIRGRKWMAIRDQVFAREPRCVVCLAKGRPEPATQVDHILALKDGGGNDLSNLRGLCADCHGDKTREDMGHKRKVKIAPDGWPEA